MSLGVYALLANGVSYSSKFSTILRTTRNADLQGARVSGAETTGADPLSRPLAAAKVDFRRQGEEGSEGFGLKERARDDAEG